MFLLYYQFLYHFIHIKFLCFGDTATCFMYTIGVFVYLVSSQQTLLRSPPPRLAEC